MARHIEVNGDLEVRKAEVIIKARYKLNPLSLKFITALIAGLKRSDDINEEYVFRVKDFKELMGLKRKDLYWAVKEAVGELLDKPLHIPTEDGFIMCNWISGGHYIESAGEVRFFIYPKLRPYLLDAQEKFLKYRLENILSLRSTYSIRMYEILKDWLELNKRYGKKAEKIISVKELREILEIPRSYPYGGSSGIKYRVIEKAKKELAEHTDIIFDYEEIKTGRKVTHLKFIIEENPKNAKNDDKQNQHGFLKSKKAFVNYLRTNYVNKPILETPNKNANGQMSKWSISERGLLYDMNKVEDNINATRSDQVFEALYNFAQKNQRFAEKLAKRE